MPGAEPTPEFGGSLKWLRYPAGLNPKMSVVSPLTRPECGPRPRGADSEEAFQALKRQSQRTNVKLHTIADKIIGGRSTFIGKSIG
jgi:ANTAR domain